MTNEEYNNMTPKEKETLWQENKEYLKNLYKKQHEIKQREFEKAPFSHLIYNYKSPNYFLSAIGYVLAGGLFILAILIAFI